MLGQARQLVGELGEPGVEFLDVQEADLVGGRGVQLGAPEDSWVTEGADAAWAVQGSVTVAETKVRRPQP
ncbi:hypothetical protein MTP06_14040 [Streptomyces sp. PLM4]|nr:hypothetical protein MTP06_14040 [Streptomyces sp. PLM4]